MVEKKHRIRAGWNQCVIIMVPNYYAYRTGKPMLEGNNEWQTPPPLQKKTTTVYSIITGS